MIDGLTLPGFERFRHVEQTLCAEICTLLAYVTLNTGTVTSWYTVDTCLITEAFG